MKSGSPIIIYSDSRKRSIFYDKICFMCSFILFFMLTLFKSINTYFKTRDKYLLSGIIFIIATLIPILPSGSFFTTYTATIFWINYALIVSFDKYEHKNEKY